MEIRGFTTFSDIENMSSGNLRNSIIEAIETLNCFCLILSKGSLDQCIGDYEHKDWIHGEVVTAIKNGCKIILIEDIDFQMPEEAKLPEDMRVICSLNRIQWNHPYQEAVIEKLKEFMIQE